MEISVPVLIIGGGPTGLLQALLLSRLNVQCLLIERYLARLAAPKAHAICPRSFEIFRQFGLNTTAIRALGSQRKDAYWVNFVTSLTGERIGKLEYERMDPGVLDSTPEMIHNIPQPTLEQYFTAELEKSDIVEIRRGVSFVSLCQDEASGQVMTTVEERASGRRYAVTSRHVIACDGRKSKVRDFLGIGSDGEELVDAMMTIHFNANLRSIIGEHVGILHWVFDPEVSGFIIGYDLSGNLVLIHNFDQNKHPIDTWTEAHCRNVVDKAIGKKVAYDILSFRPWMLSRKISQSYRSGNVFLAGDAAHSFPPNGGLGLNSGIADVHSLAYKIAFVHKGWAGDALLDTYETERKPVAEINARQSVKNGKQIFGLLKALGTAGIDDPVQARENMFRTIHDPSKQQEIKEQIEEQREHFDNLELHIGYVYGSSDVPPNASDYEPKFVPGARLPHCWIEMLGETCLRPIDVSYVSEFSSEESKTRRYSSLDLCQKDGFTVIVGRNSSWPSKTSDLLKNKNCSNIAPIRVCQLGKDFDTVDTSISCEWLLKMGLESGRAIVVRPDQHILCVLEDCASSSDLQAALDAHLGTSSIQI